MSTSPRLLAIGTPYVDLNAKHSFDPTVPPPEEVVIPHYDLTLGGSALNFARLSAKLGFAPVFVGKVGQDLFGQALPAMMKQAGVEAALIVDPRVQTNFSTNLSNEHGDTRADTFGDANKELGAEELLGQVAPHLSSVDYLYLGGIYKFPQLIPTFLELAKQAKKQNTKVVVDHNRPPQNIIQQTKDQVKQLIAECADYYFPNQKEFLDLWEEESIEAGLRKTASASKACVIVTDGKKGAWYLDESGALVNAPAFSVEVHNGTGAGDSFNAGFMAAQAKGLGVAASARYAGAVAGLRISRPELPTAQEVDDFLAAHPQK